MAGFRKYCPAAAAFLQMMSMALTTTALSFFVGPVCRELGFGRGSFTVYYSILTAAGTLASPFLGQIIQQRGLRFVATVSAFWTAAGLMMFSFCRELWMFYLAGAFTGFFGTACVTLCAGVTVQTRYHGSAASRLTGLVMAGSGVGGMLVSLVLPELIDGWGWRWGYRLTALVWLGLGLCAA
jgi:MFS family permease